MEFILLLVLLIAWPIVEELANVIKAFLAIILTSLVMIERRVYRWGKREKSCPLP